MLETKREAYKEDLNAGDKECEIQRVLMEESSMLQKSEMLEKKRYPRLGIQIENRRRRPQGDTDTETKYKGRERKRKSETGARDLNAEEKESVR
jgi:hypothetical protein